jgi:ankyrin repeat protein
VQRGYILPIAGVCFLIGTLCAQTTSRVEFGRDVQPILRSRCYSCHGSSQQMQGLRLDRRRSAIPNRVGANRASIVPGNSGASPVYLKLIGKQAGLQMPPDGALSAEQINLIKSWIDQGAEWPDEFSGEVAPSIPDRQAVQIIEALRKGDRRLFLKMLSDNPGVLKAKGARGSTPLMAAVLYGDVESVRLQLERGADPNVSNDVKATALMYAVDSTEKTRLLLDHGADPNVQSEDGQTPLLIASSRPGAGSVAKLLLDHGANPSTENPFGGSPLTLAAGAAEGDLLKLLLERGAQKSRLPLGQAVRSGCTPCVDALIPFSEKRNLDDALSQAVAAADIAQIKNLLQRGASSGSAALSSMALSPETFPLDLVETLVNRATDLNAKTRMGGTVLDLAKLQGDTPLVRALVKAGAKEESISDQPVPAPHPTASIRAAIERSLPLLDRADVAFIKKAGCISCHNNSLVPMARAAARKNGIPVNEQVASSQLQTISDILAGNGERALQAIGLAGRGDTAGYILLGLAAEKYPPNEITDTWARYLKNLQQTDGHWRVQAGRPPLESSDIQGTATAMRSIQIYGPRSKQDEYRKAVQLAGRWLETAQPKTTEDRAFLLLGIHWNGGNKQVMDRVAKDLLAEQRPDGGWAQLSTLASDAYATGQALFALSESHSLPVAAPAYQRGVQFLLKSQLADGSWHVRTRTLPVQPYFASDFPHGPDQFISAAATSWATMALAAAK